MTAEEIKEMCKVVLFPEDSEDIMNLTDEKLEEIIDEYKELPHSFCDDEYAFTKSCMKAAIEADRAEYDWSRFEDRHPESNDIIIVADGDGKVGLYRYWQNGDGSWSLRPTPSPCAEKWKPLPGGSK